MMSNKEKKYAAAVLLMMFLLVSYDLYSDFEEGSSYWHLILEGSFGAMAAFRTYTDRHVR